MRHLSWLLVVSLALFLTLAPLTFAQAPPPWKQGQPSEMANSPLAPVAQPPAPKAPGEIPIGKIKVPQGFKVELWAHGINNARVMTWGDKGTLFVSSRVAGNVYAVTDKGSSREVKVIAKGLNLPNGVAFKDGTLYIAETSRTAGSTSRSGRTASSTSTSGRPATSASRPTPTRTSRASMRTGPGSSTGPTACATASASTGTR
jgi:glucose/arabinose dehydrogenase